MGSMLQGEHILILLFAFLLTFFYLSSLVHLDGTLVELFEDEDEEDNMALVAR
jgi:hypothetical protein